jgi:hypothetical protein
LAGSWLRRSFLFGVLLALLAIAFEPLIFQCAVLFVAGLSLYCLLESESRTMMAASIFRTGLTGGIFALGLSAVQILPAMELFPLSERGAGFDFNAVSIWSMHPLDFLNIIVPNLFGRADTIGYPLYWGEAFHHGREAYLVSFFLGGAALFLAVLSFLHRRKKLQLILVTLALAGFALALGRFNPIYQWLFEHLNFFHLGRYPSKYFLLATLAVCILASLGVEVALQAGAASLRERRKILIIGFCGILIAITFLGVSAYYQTNPQSMRALLSSAISPQDVAGKDFSTILRQLNRSLVSTGAYLLLCSMLVLGAARWQRSSLLSGLFWVVLGAELIPANLGLSPLISDADMSYESEIMKFARAQTSKEPYRVVPPTIIRPQPDIKLHTPNQSAAWLSLYYRMSGQPMYGIASGIEYSVYLSVDHLNTRESDNLYKACMALDEDSRIRMLENLNSSLLLSFGEIENSRLRPLRSFDTRSDIEVNAYWLDLAAPRAYFAPGVIKASSREEALIFVSRPDLSAFGNVVLEDPSISGQATQEGSGEVKVLAHENQSVLCEIEAKTPGYLVLLDSYYPGWRAWVDGTEASILRANYAFRAVRLSPGSHKVEFKYRPRNFYVGLIVTCLTLLTGVVFCAFSYRKK